MDKITKTDRLFIDQVQQLTGLTSIGAGVTIINSFLLSFILWGYIPAHRIIIWFSSLLIITLIRFILQKSYNTEIFDIKMATKRKNSYLLFLTATGIVWGSVGIFLFPPDSIGHQTFIAFVLGGMIAGSVAIYSVFKTAFLAYSLPVALPVFASFLSINDKIHHAMAAMVGLFWVVMFVTVRKLNKEIIKSLGLKYENLDLITSLENEINERKKIEEELRIWNQEIEKIIHLRTKDLQKLNKKLINEIEERKEIEIELRDNQIKYMELANSLPQIVFEADADGFLKFVNHNAIGVFGYVPNTTPGGITSINIFDLVIPEDRVRAKRDFEKVFKGEMSKTGEEYTALRKDGTTFPIVIHASPIIRENKLMGIRGIVIDLTENKNAERERKRLESQLQRAQKMEALGTLAGGVAHDLNNILSGIVSYPDLLLMQIPQDGPLIKPIQTMKKSGEKAAAIVQDLLTLTRRGVVIKKVLNLNDIVSDYLESPEYKKMISYHMNVRIITDLDPDLLNISGSSIHLLKSVMNLVSNAAEAMTKGGEIYISTTNRYLDQPVKGYDTIEEGDYVILKVSDSGVGIPREDIERIFEPFFTKKEMGRSGTGLGMAVVWGTVKDHNGYIDVISPEGKGTTFTLYFPVTRELLPDKKMKDENLEITGNGESILVIDDIEEQREIASALLSQLGYSVASVSSGEEAIEYLKTNTTDLLVLDMIMGKKMDGLETYKKIIEISPHQKAVIASGFSETQGVREAQSLGAGMYLKKPYTLKKIGRAVRRELDK